jgi:peptidoglycan/xylan/chitin deacetylase (PgdA/CDA1 family)
MNKKLIKIYLLIFVAYFSVSMLLPKAFPESYKIFNYFRLKAAVKIKSQPVLALPIITHDKINIMFILDDGWETQYSIGYDLFQRHNMKANISVVPYLVGHEKYMTLNQISDLYIDGWDILNHTYNHYDLTNLDSKEKLKQFNKGRSWLKSHEFVRTMDVVIFPGGFYDHTTIEILADNSFKSARSLEEVWDISLSEKERNMTIRNLDSSINPLWAMDWIDEAIDSGTDIIFVLHKLENVTTDTGMQYNPEKLEEILNYITSKKQRVNVVTYSQWLNSK